ncbi:MAG TPA: hypothetical protein VLY03_13645 [Bacteroidota bacterium]|nr:hypothetical protein [Bacteroidota bacterium]
MKLHRFFSGQYPVFPFIVLFLSYSALHAQDPSYDPANFSTGSVKIYGKNCKPTGTGGDAYLNELKNRDLAPASYESVAYGDILTKWERDFPAGRGKSHYRLDKKSVWSDAERKAVTGYEMKGVSVEGYLIAIKPQQAEACNCGIRQYHDYHLWLSDAPLPSPKPKHPDKSKTIVAEISPRLISAHPGWNQKAINHLIGQHSKIRISGWVTWDEEHPEQIGKERGTLWEIHPIHKIEVFSNGQWTAI